MSSGRVLVVAFAWGFAEATLFFVVPDVPIGWVALRRPRQILPVWLAATAGGTVGALATYAAVKHGWDPDGYFRSLPGVQPGDLERVHDEIADDPTRAFLTGAVTGMPVKFHVSEAARQGIPLPRTLGLVLLNRAPRIAVFGLLLGSCGVVARRIAMGPRPLAALYGLGWAVFYGWYWLGRRDDDV